MKEITQEDFKQFTKKHKEVTIENVKLTIDETKEIKELQPKDFKPESTTVWSFPDRGNWATHYLNAKYRGNWAPEVARNLILKYTEEGDLILDPMIGSGTTAIECKLLGRDCIAVDINPDAIMITKDRLNFNTLAKLPKSEIKTFIGDARHLDLIKDNSVDFVLTHPPYASMISYSNEQVEGDLSIFKNVDKFADEIKKVAKELFRVLKSGKYCAILMGDSRKSRHYIPITTRVMQAFLDVGFVLKENIIKVQHNMMSNARWRNNHYDFYLIAHENLYVFRKPEKDEKLNGFKESVKWW